MTETRSRVVRIMRDHTRYAALIIGLAFCLTSAEADQHGNPYFIFVDPEGYQLP